MCTSICIDLCGAHGSRSFAAAALGGRLSFLCVVEIRTIWTRYVEGAFAVYSRVNIFAMCCAVKDLPRD